MSALLAHHQELINASGISPEVARARGYRSVERHAELERLGFGRQQRIVPTLLVPVWGVDGRIATYQHRPDSPRVVKGKPRKYETPAGSAMALDVPPAARPWIGDPGRPLFVTEGARKADAAVSRELCCVALLGVWNWRGTNDTGGKMALPDWESVALNDREVLIAFDSDVMVKREVHAALARFKPWLERRGARVRLIYLPAAKGGGKQGLDDYLAAGHSVDDLLALASDSARVPDVPDVPRSPYVMEGGRICEVTHTREGDVVHRPLCNFDARIVGEVVADDGSGEDRGELEVDGTLADGRALGVVRVPLQQFGAMSWPLGLWGARAIVSAGMGARDKLREAMQHLSGDVPRRRVYQHAGWRRIDDEWVYLTASGAIGADGAVNGIEVELTGALGRIALPVPPDGEHRAAAVRASLALWDLAPPAVSVPVVATTYLPPLREALVAEPPDFATWVYGPSGVLKSELAALAQAHYGPFTRTSLQTFKATANALERLAFGAKDALLVVDDYHPAQSQREAQEMATVVTRLLRGVGNGAGRSRMRADTNLRPDLPPRCVVLATGERLPEGHSTAARMLPTTVEPGDVRLDALSAGQDNRALLAEAMAAYVQWLAGRMDELRAALPARFAALRSEAQQPGAHLREPSQVAYLRLALETWLAFVVDCGVLTHDQADTRIAEAWTVLLQLAAGQAEALAAETPAQRFLALLGDGFRSRRAYLEHLDGGEPADRERWGWEPYSRVWVDDGERREETEYRTRSGAVLLGWLDDDCLLLFPEATYQFVAARAREAGQVFPVELRTLLKRLEQAGVIVAEPGSGRRTPKVRRGDQTVRVIKLSATALSGPENGEHGEHGEQPAPANSAVPQNCSPNGRAPRISGNTFGEQPSSNGSAVPHVPYVPRNPAPGGIGGVGVTHTDDAAGESAPFAPGDRVWPLTPDGQRVAGGPDVVKRVEMSRYRQEWADLASGRRWLTERLERLDEAPESVGG